jgi:broad specificity phosphatase PhoE
MPMIVVVRHGRTDHNATGKLLGRIDAPLDETGIGQARLLAAAVGPVDRVISSPLRRTRQTAEEFGLPVEVDVAWIELDYGELDGRPLADVPAATWAQWRADPDFAPPGGETLRALGERVGVALDRLAAEARPGDGTTVVVTHVSPIKAAVAWALGAGDETSWRLWVAPASISRIQLTERGGVLHTFNEVAHLGTG